MSGEGNAKIVETQQLIRRLLDDYDDTVHQKDKELQRITRRFLRWLISDARQELRELTRIPEGLPNPR